MIRVPYNTQLRPPAPFVLVGLTNPLDGAAVADLPAQIDTAADRTLVPLGILESLGAVPIDHIPIGGVGGRVIALPVFVVTLAVRGFPGRPVAVVAHPDEPWTLLGRDVLNGYRLTLNGPDLTLEMA